MKFNSRGLSLVEVLVALSITGILGSVTMSFVEFQRKSKLV